VKRLFFPIRGTAVLSAAATVLSLTLLAATASAQTTPTSTPAAATGPQNEVQGFFVACEADAVVNFRGTMLAGFDIFYQVFAGTTGSGTALTSLRQVQVDGTFTFSERVAYTNGQTVPAGQSASAKVSVARDSDPSRVDFEFVLADVQDGCTSQQTQPQNPTGTSIDTGTTGAVVSTSDVFSLPAPNGQTLNPNLSPEPTVVVGARLSDAFRSETPGLIYAACENFPLALPGIVYDNDQVTVFWSWFTRTQEQMEQHLANANYSVRMNGAPFNQVVQSDIQRVGGLFYVFYSSFVGNLRPGHYEIEYRLTWNQPVNDGFNDYGPGTDFPTDQGNCNFDIIRNPTSEPVAYTNMFNPSPFPVHDILPPEPPTP